MPKSEKESYKWLLSAERSQYCFSAGQAPMVTHIGDLQSDLYEEFATIPDAQNHLLVTSRQNRRLLGQKTSLYTYLSKQPCEGTYTVHVHGDARRGQTALLSPAGGSVC